MQHAHRVREIYGVTHATKTALQHLRELRTVYTNTPTAKKNYHLLATNVPKEHIEAHRLHNAYTTLCLERRRRYDQAKQDTMCQYADMKTLYPLRTELLSEYTHFVDFLRVLRVVPCLCARLRCLLHLKIIKVQTT